MSVRIVGIVTLAFFAAFSFAPMAIAATGESACRMEKAEECKHVSCPKHNKKAKKEAAKEDKKAGEHAACSMKHGAKPDEAKKEEVPVKEDKKNTCSISCCDHEDLSGASSDTYVPSCEKQSRVFDYQQVFVFSAFNFVSHLVEPFERPPAIG